MTEVRERHEKAALDHDVEIGSAPSRPGTMAGAAVRGRRVVGGEERIVVEHITRVPRRRRARVADGPRSGLLPHRGVGLTVGQRRPRARSARTATTTPEGCSPPPCESERHPRRRRRAAGHAVDARPARHPGTTSDAALTSAKSSSADMRRGRRVAGGEVAGDPLDGRVHRCRYAVQAAEQDDLAVEIVRLDRAGAARQALPRRAAARGRPPTSLICR